MYRNLFNKLLVATLLAASGSAIAQSPEPGSFLPVDPMALPLDRQGVWTLHFSYMPPRIITVNTPNGKRTAWYMVYRVWNTSDTPVPFMPEFELVTKDGELRTFLDEPQPMVLDQIRKIEDPTGELHLHSSVTISKERIPVTKPDSVPRAVYGVAIWLDVPEKAARTNHFSIYVTGLSNGLAVSESDTGGERISRKTLQLDFVKPTAADRPQANDIRVNTNSGLGGEHWIYRVAPTFKPIAEKKK
jgi:hypothetical protein